jgi:hypothetical protein
MAGAESSGSGDIDRAVAAAAQDRRELVADLERRIVDLSAAEESQFGKFTRRDWVICLFGFVLLPYLMFLCFWP